MDAMEEDIVLIESKLAAYDSCKTLAASGAGSFLSSHQCKEETNYQFVPSHPMVSLSLSCGEYGERKDDRRQWPISIRGTINRRCRSLPELSTPQFKEAFVR